MTESFKADSDMSGVSQKKIKYPFKPKSMSGSINKIESSDTSNSKAEEENAHDPKIPLQLSGQTAAFMQNSGSNLFHSGGDGNQAQHLRLSNETFGDNLENL